MTLKHLFVVVVLLLVLSIVIFLILRSASQVVLSPDDQAEAARLSLHPLTSAKKRAAAEKNLVKTWDQWVKQTVEIGLGKEIAENPALNTPEAVADERALRLYKATFVRERFEALQMPHPAYPIWPSREQLAKLSEVRFSSSLYQGPQTPDALMAEFDADFLESYPQSVDWDTYYPKTEWIQRLLDKGVHFNESNDYSYFLELRRDLLKKKGNPDEWRSGKYGIPITTKFEEYEEGFINRKVWEERILEKVSAKNMNTQLTTIFFPPSHPDKYLPVIGNMTYVRRGEGSALSTWGTMLTKEQQEDILYRGKHPEEIEIVYIDKDYNILSEPPKPYNHEEWVKKNSYIIKLDDTLITPENYEQVLGEPMPEGWQKWYEENHPEETGAVPQAFPDEDIDAMRAAAREAAAAERVKFEQGLRELERLMNMSDAEIAAELERRFMPQLPELPTAERLKKALWSEAQSPLMTPARFEGALQILLRYGPEEGMHRLHTADPKLAAQVRQLFGQPPAERPPEKPNTAEPPQPPEGPPAQR